MPDAAPTARRISTQAAVSGTALIILYATIAVQLCFTSIYAILPMVMPRCLIGTHWHFAQHIDGYVLL